MNPDTALLETPRSTRLHIGIFGRRNIGKSSLLNAITDQYVAIVSAMPGTTTDPVSKTMELPGPGPCLLTDTAGYDDPRPSARCAPTRLPALWTNLCMLLPFLPSGDAL